VKAAAFALSLALAPGVCVAEAPRGAAAWETAADAESLHGVPVELAPERRLRLDEETEAYVQGVAPPPAKPAPSDPLDRVLTAAGRLPEPATWALMILGFGGVAGAMRHRVRKSERDFNDRIRRITDGEE
jgi:hypothetical protein